MGGGMTMTMTKAYGDLLAWRDSKILHIVCVAVMKIVTEATECIWMQGTVNSRIQQPVGHSDRENYIWLARQNVQQGLIALPDILSPSQTFLPADDCQISHDSLILIK